MRWRSCRPPRRSRRNRRYTHNARPVGVKRRVDALDEGRRLGGVLVAEWSKAELSGNAESSLVSGTVPATGQYGQ
jgi:hypothetical protein